MNVATLTAKPQHISVPTYGDFVEAMRRKHVYGDDNGLLRGISRLERRRDWAIPSYDFRRLLDPTFPGNVLNRIPTGMQQVLVPRKDRAFLFSFGEERQLLVQRFGVTTYPDDDGGHRFWFYAKAPDGPWLSRDGERARWEALVFEANYLLGNPQFFTVTPSRASVGNANKRRGWSGAPPLQATSIVNLTRIQRLGAAAQGTGLGLPKRPHDRIEHVRRLRDGRVIPVRACEIHKGVAPPAIDSVVRP